MDTSTLRRLQAPAMALLLVIALVTGLTGVTAQGSIPDGDPATIDRIDEADPARFAIAVSQQRWADGSAQQAVVVTGNDFADALAAGSLAGDGPLLYASDIDLLLAELRRTTPTDRPVLLVGGTAAVSAAVEQAVRDAGYSPTRLEGPSRFETAAAVAVRAADGVRGGRVFVAVGDNWVDSVAIAPWLSAEDAPLLLTPSAELHPAAEGALRTLAPSRITIVGGTAAVSDTVEGELRALAPTVDRVAGSSRDTTAIAIATEVWGGTASGDHTLTNLFLEDGWRFGLAGAGLAGDLRAPLVSVHPDVDLRSTAALVCAGTGDLIAFGPQAQVADGRAQALRTCPAPAPPPAAEPLLLRGDGLAADLPFGTDFQAAIARVQDALGAPSRDSGYVVACEFAGDDRARYVTFGDQLTIGTYEEGAPTLDLWSLRPPLEGPAAGLTTAAGIGIGSTNSQIRAAYPSAVLNDDNVFGPFWQVPLDGREVLIFVDGTAPGAAANSLFGGDIVFCD